MNCQPAHHKAQSSATSRLWPAIALLILTTVVYWPVGGFEFVSFDDPLYVTENARVQTGMSLENIGWAFTTTAASNYHPLTWLSHMLDVELFGLDAGRHHQVNLLLHLTNTLLLFALLLQFTGARWRSFMVAALFALHPLHVESVAWVAERKDVLSTLFWLLTMWFYGRYAKRPTVASYLPVFFSLALGLLAKPMLVTLPLVLLLLDHWPLQRLDRQQRAIPFRCLVLEKTPLFLLAAASCLITYIAQNRGHSLASLENIILPYRLANGAIAYVTYLAKTFSPSGLAVYYPHPGPAVSLAAAGASLATLAAVSWLAFAKRRQAPSLWVGWYWYVLTLLPVIGLVQAGLQARADRYTYIPLIGVFIALCWTVPQLLRKWPYSRAFLAATATVILLFLAPLTRLQVNNWRDNLTLYRHAVAVTDNNYLAHNNLGIALGELGRTEEAISHFQAAVHSNPSYAKAYNNLGAALERMGETDPAIDQFARSVALDPGVATTHVNLGEALSDEGEIEAAAIHFETAVRLDPTLAEAHSDLGIALEQMGRYDEAIDQFATVLQLEPADAAAHSNMGDALAQAGDAEEAVDHYRAALAINPNSAHVHDHLAVTLETEGHIQAALAEYDAALRINPRSTVTRNNLGGALEKLGRFSQAVRHYSDALRINPRDSDARKRLDRLMARMRQHS